MTPITIANESFLLLLINIRHYENLLPSNSVLLYLQNGMEKGIISDYRSMELRHACPVMPYSRALSALSENTGEEIPPMHALRSLTLKQWRRVSESEHQEPSLTEHPVFKNSLSE